MAIDSSTKFGIVYTTPSDFVSKIGNQTNTDGKLYVLHGSANSGITQGIYMVESNSSDPDGSTNVQMLSSGALASSNNAGLMSTSLFNKLDTLDLNKYLLAANYLQVSSTKDGYVPKADGTDGTIDSQTNDWVLTSNSGTIGWYKLPANAFSNTTYTGSGAISLSGTTFSHTNSGVAAGYYGEEGSNRTLAFGETFKVVDTSVNSYGHITAISTKKLTLPRKPATAGTADSANKVANSLKVQGDGTDIISFNGSTAKTINIVGGTNISLSKDATNGKITIATTGVPTTSEMNTAIATALSSALQYCGTVASNSDVSTAATKTAKKKGDVYVASATFKPSSTYVNNWVDSSVEAGDLFIFDGSKFDIINGENQVSNANATLSIGGSTTVATVDGTNITISLPSSGYYTHPASISGTNSVNTSDGGDFAFSSSSNSLQVITGALRDASGHISKLVYKDVTLPSTAYSDTQYTHPASISGTTFADSSLKSTTATTLVHGGTFTVATGVYRDASGHISKVATESFKLPAAYSHPTVGTTNTACNASANTAVTLSSGGTFTVVNGVYRDANGHVNKVATTTYTMPSSAFTDTKFTSLTLNADSTVDVPSALYADVISNTKISASGTSGTSLSTTMTAVRVATQKAVDAAQEAATVYWETL